jgi:hypothetical protein
MKNNSLTCTWLPLLILFVNFSRRNGVDSEGCQLWCLLALTFFFGCLE